MFLKTCLVKMQCLQPCCVSFFASVCLCLCLQLFLGAQCGGVLAVSSGLQLFLGTWWRLRVLFSQEELVVSTLCVGEQCAEAEMLKSGSQGGEEAPSSLQVTSSGLSLSFFFFSFWPRAWGQTKLRGIKTNAQPVPATSPCWSQFSSVAQSYLTLCDPVDCSTSGFPVHHQLPEFTQTHVH